ncbi:hypothetical protein HK405_009840 [Cladochytrium tenue]|nr:hypothetical protein HK405_009840 [Cladochytrium tenue]
MGLYPGVMTAPEGNGTTHTSTTGAGSATRTFSSEIFGAGIGLMVAGAGLKWLQEQIVLVTTRIMEPVASVKIESADESFAYVAEYLAKYHGRLYTRQSYADIVAGVIRRLFYWMNLILSILTLGWLHIRNLDEPHLVDPHTRLASYSQ